MRRFIMARGLPMQLNEPIHDVESGKFLFFLHGKMGGVGGLRTNTERRKGFIIFDHFRV